MSTNKVLFLDIDGVLNSDHYLYKGPSRKRKKDLKSGKREALIDSRSAFWVGLFCRITKCKVVLSSSWRMLWDDDMIPNPSTEKTDVKLRRFGIKLFGKTSSQAVELKNKYHIDIHKHVNLYTYSFWRGTQILSYIESHNLNIEDVIIFDDDPYDIWCFEELKDQVIQTKFYEGGFTFKKLKEALRLIYKHE